MFLKIWFALTQYLWLVSLLLTAFGAGSFFVYRLSTCTTWSSMLRAVLAITTGLGVLIVSLLLLAVFGLFKPFPVAVLMLPALGLGLWRSWRDALLSTSTMQTAVARAAPLVPRWFWSGIVVLLALPFLTMPLQPPVGWDELMYHLPYAKLWVADGKLTIAPWLRYPLFPYNYELLYATALLFDGDVLPHLIHAAAGVLVVVGLWAAGSRWFGKPAGALAALMYLVASMWGFDVAYVDLGLALFVGFGFLALALWFERREDGLATLASFFFGLAVGTKYQGLLFAPILAGWLVVGTRRPVLWLKAFIAFAVGGAFWYVRSFCVSGDPIHPLGATIFGFWLWDQRDLAGQISNIQAHGGWPKAYLLPSVLTVFFWRRYTPLNRALCVSGFVALALWFATSRYERYLMPAYPLLAMMTGLAVVQVGERIAFSRILGRAALALPALAKSVGLLVLLAIASLFSFNETRKYAERIAANPEQRGIFLSPKLGSYRLFKLLDGDSCWRLYQFGFEGELYYAPMYTEGDWFGRARYRHVFQTASKPEALARWLRGLGVNGFVVNIGRAPFSDIKFGAGFDEYFELVAEVGLARLYRIHDWRKSSREPVAGCAAPL